MRRAGSTTKYPNDSTYIRKSKRTEDKRLRFRKGSSAKLEDDAQLKEADLSVSAIAERNEVTLSGTVRSHAAREKAIELAKSAKPGVLVNDKIDVKPAA